MDYRHTEDFARRMEAAALRARYLRGNAPDEFWNAVARAARAAGQAVWRRLTRRGRRDTFKPQA